MLNHPHHGHDPQTHRPVVLAAKPQFARARFGRVRLPAEAIAWVSILLRGRATFGEHKVCGLLRKLGVHFKESTNLYIEIHVRVVRLAFFINDQSLELRAQRVPGFGA